MDISLLTTVRVALLISRCFARKSLLEVVNDRPTLWATKYFCRNIIYMYICNLLFWSCKVVVGAGCRLSCFESLPRSFKSELNDLCDRTLYLNQEFILITYVINLRPFTTHVYLELFKIMSVSWYLIHVCFQLISTNVSTWLEKFLYSSWVDEVRN